MENIEKYRQNGVIDVSTIVSETSSKIDLEQRGAREKFWFSNYEYLFKGIFNNSYEDYAEVIAMKIAKYFDIDCATYDFATYNGQPGVVTKNFVKEDDGEELISGTEVINYVLKNHIEPIELACKKYKTYEKSLLQTASIDEKKAYITQMLSLLNSYGIDYKYENDIMQILQEQSTTDSPGKIDEMLEKVDEIYQTLEDTYKDLFDKKPEKFSMQVNNLFDLWSIIDIYVKKNNLGGEETTIQINNALYDIMMFDMLTLQGDRHPANWALIVNKKKGTVKMAPIFDNSNIYNLNRSKAIDTIDETIQRINAEKITSSKKERMMRRIKESIYHPMPRLGIDDERRNDYLKQTIEFAKQYSASDLEKFENKLTQLDDNAISFIFTDIQSSTKREIPDIVKKIVTESIKINRKELLTIIGEVKAERSVEHNETKS